MKNIYLFSEIDSSIRETLGKNACEMIDTEPNSLGFVLTQEACAEFYITREIEKDLRGRITAVLDGLCSDAGVKFGESATVSIFASTVVPMPGILEKINGVGLNESVLSTLPDEAAQKAWALHLQLMKAFACELYVSSQHFTDLENEATGKYGVDEIEKLSVEALRELCAAFKNVYAAQGVCSLSTDPYEQFFMLLKTAFRSWDNPRACVYRRRKGITDSGLSIAVQLVDLKTGKYFKNRTTIAAADRNNKEKDASNKSEPQGEFKRIEIDGDLFEGYFLNGKKNGRGKYIWANGNVYDGNWVDGKCTGKGRITWSSGASFDGEWKDNQMSEGKYSFADGSVYEGSFKNGKYDGYGKRIYKDGEKYEGQWHDDKKHGHGTCTWANGDTYEGDWKDGKRCGYGEQTFESGSKYFGWWKDNDYHGFGRFVFASGSENVGEFKNGNENGIFLIKRDGEWYGYKWVDGEIIPSLDGALITYNDGSGYVGQTVTEHRRGLTVRIRQGYGEYRFPGNSRNGSTNIYQGQFSQDVPYGTGIRVDTTGEEPIILASDDFRGDSIPDGKCRAVRLTGVDSYKYALFYEGGYRDGEAFGSGMLYVVGDSENDHYRYRPYGLPIGSIVRCDHFDGGPTGAAIVTDEYGEMRYGRFVDGFWEPNK